MTARWPLIVVALMLTFAAATVRGADTLISARERYAAAEYEDALAILDRVKLTSEVADARAIEQYRAYCLLALNRQTDAEAAIAAVVTTDPLYQPADADVSPRIRTAFKDVRRRMLPAIVQGRYASAKAAFDAKQFAIAAAGFAELLSVMADPDLEPHMSRPPLADLKMLAVGFSDLASRAATPAPLPVATQPPPMALPIGRPPTHIYSVEEPRIVAPVAVQQAVPTFPDISTVARTGVLELVIDETGAVESAMMRVSVQPRIDAALIEAARRWKYQPATLDNAPVKYRKLVQIDMKR